ncbi:hypothetical protein ACIQPR_09055 [Streptomyces sp. NPDC091280]|uniref:hypothetical protein n=1 Tax=Streptomyces sp. NPDC091280 TaxID=3365984 RepID=UPI0037F149A2
MDLPSDLALRFGFLTSQQQHAVMAEARAATLEQMDETIEAFRDDGLADPELQELRQLRGNARAFRRRDTRHSKFIASKFRVRRPSCPWPGPSVARYLLTGPRKDLVQDLAAQAYRGGSRLLEASMEEAWQRAFDRYGRRV